jgi:putative thioredoxin
MLIGQPGADAPAAPAADLIKDTDTAGFMVDVIEASQDTPVIVDFWAPWCGPCKQLTPALERLVKQYAGKVRLVKINVDENQDLAQQFRVQSIPAVYGFKAGRPVDGFMGALPESQLKQFIERLTGGGGSPLDEALAEADALAKDGQNEEALMIYQEVLAQDPVHVKALAGALRAYVALGQDDTAREVMGRLPAQIKNAPDIQGVQAALDLKAATANTGDAAERAALEAKVAADPKDMQARLDLAMARFGAGEREKAVEDLLAMVKADRAWNEQAARKQLVKFFEAFGPADPLTVSGRRRLSAILFS